MARHARFVWPRAALSVVVALTGVVVVAVGDGGSSGVPVAGGQVLRLVQRAPQALADARSVRMTMSFHVSSGGQDAEADGEYLGDVGGKGTGSVEAQGLNLRFIADGDRLYVAIPESKQPIFDNRHWVSTRIRQAEIEPGFDGGAGYLALLAGTRGTVTGFGSETVDGVETTHYRVTVDLAEALARSPTADPGAADQLQSLGLSTLPMEIWLDGDGMPRQLRMEFSVQDTSFEVELHLAPSDEAVRVDVPSPGDVYEVTSTQELSRIVRPLG